MFYCTKFEEQSLDNQCRPIYIKLSQSVRKKPFDEWAATVRFHVCLEQRKLATAGRGSNWPVPFPFSAISRRSFTVCNDMDSRLSFLNML